MTPEQFSELLRFIQENNAWGNNMFAVIEECKRKAIKYVDAIFDSRDGKVWLVKFRSVVGMKDNDKIEFRVESQKDIEKIYNWLNEPLKK